VNRRGFLGAILAAGAAPWVAKAGVLMPVKTLVVPEFVIHPFPFFGMEVGRYENIRFIETFDITTTIAEYEALDRLYRRAPPMTRFKASA